jgi:CBS-domain-containing membrane protein
VVTSSPPGGRAATARVVGDVVVRAPKLHVPTASVADLLDFFADDHVHMALVVDDDGRLLTAVERPDLAGADPTAPATGVGTLEGRTALAGDALDDVWAELRASGRRRLAVVDERGRVVGLLCLKHHGRGFCSDEDVRDRAAGRDGC